MTKLSNIGGGVGLVDSAKEENKARAVVEIYRIPLIRGRYHRIHPFDITETNFESRMVLQKHGSSGGEVAIAMSYDSAQHTIAEVFEKQWGCTFSQRNPCRNGPRRRAAVSKLACFALHSGQRIA